MKNNIPWLDENGYYSFAYLLSFNKTYVTASGEVKMLYPFRLAVGGRGTGKTVDLQEIGITQHLKGNGYFVWVRLKEPPIKKILSQPYLFIDDVNRQKFKMQPDDLTTDGNMVKYKGKDLGYFASLSTYHNDKSTMDFKHMSLMILDEFKKEKTEKNTFDIHGALINEVETVTRDRDRLILAACNTISDASDLLDIFGFEPREYGLYKLPKLGVIIHYFEDSDKFKAERPSRISSRLATNHIEASNSLNNKVIIQDVEIMKPASAFMKQFIIKFDDNVYLIYGSHWGRVAFKEVGEVVLNASLNKPGMNENAKRLMALPVYAWHIKHSMNGVLFDKDLITKVKDSISRGNVVFSSKQVYLLLKEYLTKN